jgi:hypothetical protein
MLKQLPLKKEYWLVAATIIVLLLSYQLAFKKTLEAWQHNTSLKHQLAQSTDLSYQPEYQERKNNNLGKIVNLYKADTLNFRSNIISIISSIAEKENVKLTEVPTQDPLYRTPQFIIQKLNFEGDYFSLAKVLNELQRAKEIGVIRGAMYKMTALHLNANDSKKLVLEVYLEIVR